LMKGKEEGGNICNLLCFSAKILKAFNKTLFLKSPVSQILLQLFSELFMNYYARDNDHVIKIHTLVQTWYYFLKQYLRQKNRVQQNDSVCS
jgi:hypothetical protein